ncbi:MAG: DinB family protein [Thermomicrobiales bacterium]
MDQLTKIRQAYIGTMAMTARTLGHLLAPVSQEQATTLRDGPEGWTTVEVVCHLRDFDGFFRGRAEMILAEETPNLPAYDHEAIAIEREYNDQQLTEAYDALLKSREATQALFANLTPEQWERAGIHPESGYFTLTDAARQVGLHDLVHIEQILKILTGRTA